MSNDAWLAPVAVCMAGVSRASPPPVNSVYVLVDVVTGLVVLRERITSRLLLRVSLRAWSITIAITTHKPALGNHLLPQERSDREFIDVLRFERMGTFILLLKFMPRNIQRCDRI